VGSSIEERLMRVRDMMTYGVIGVPETATIAEAVETMLRSQFKAVQGRAGIAVTAATAVSACMFAAGDAMLSRYIRQGELFLDNAAGAPL
jgi:CBS domain-containing protein